MIGRNIITCIAAALLIALPARVQADIHDTRIKQLAAVRALKQAVEELHEFRSHDIAGIMEDMMQSRPAEFKNREKARKSLQEWYRQEQDRFIENRIKRIAEEFGEKGKVFPGQWLSNYMDKESGLKSRMKNIIKDNIRTVFQPSFAIARDRAVAGQWEKINFGIYPDANDVEGLSSGGRAEIDGIIQTLDKNMSGKISFFDENSRDMDKVIAKVMEDSINQFNGQLDTMKKSSGRQHMGSLAIADAIRADIEDFINSLEKVDGRHIYPVFPSIKRAIAPIADSIMQDRAIQFINSSDAESLISIDDLRDIMMENLPAHKQLVESTLIIYNKSISKFRKDLKDLYIAKADKTDGHINKTGQWAENFFRKKKGETDLTGSRLLSIIAEKLPVVRKEIADEQLDKYFTKIYRLEIELPEQIIVEYYLTKNTDANSGRFHPRKDIDINEIPDLTDIKDFGKKRDILIDEAVEKLKSILSDKLLNEGYRTLAKQIIIIDSQRETMGARIEKAIRGGRQNNIFNSLFPVFREGVLSRWRQERNHFDPPLGSRYTSLFNYAEDLIRSLLKLDIAEKNARITVEKQQQKQRRHSQQQYEDPIAKLPPGTKHNKIPEKAYGTCEEKLSDCRQELKTLKDMFRQLRKGMI